jgi:hypothetical protein
VSDARAPAGRRRAAVPGALTVLLLALLLPRGVPAQGLGDAAAQERARREARPKDPAKAFTDEDLPTREDEEAEDGEAGEEEEDETPELSKVGAADPLRAELDRRREERALKEREWRARFTEARARVREAEARCWQEVVRTRFHNGIPVQMKVQEFVESEEFRQAKQDLADLQEEFRRTGLPPGWARE